MTQDMGNFSLNSIDSAAKGTLSSDESEIVAPPRVVVFYSSGEE